MMSADAERSEDYGKFICFQVRGQEMAVPITAVKETIEAPRLTPLPLCPPFVAGLANLRGDVVAVLDLGELLLGPRLTPPPAPHDRPRVVLLRMPDGHGTLCGLLVDRLTAARKLPRRALHPPPPALKDAAGLLCAVAHLDDREARSAALSDRRDAADGPRALLVLDPDRIPGCDKLRPFRRQVGEVPAP